MKITRVDGPTGFAEWLRVVMAERGYGQRRLALRSGVDHSTISRLLNGRREPLLDTADKLARALGVQLVIGAGPKP